MVVHWLMSSGAHTLSFWKYTFYCFFLVLAFCGRLFLYSWFYCILLILGLLKKPPMYFLLRKKKHFLRIYFFGTSKLNLIVSFWFPVTSTNIPFLLRRVNILQVFLLMVLFILENMTFNQNIIAFAHFDPLKENR